ncbi:cell division protein FtsA, partial [Patescibacteria group bacterium]|nr:cell division protein FtsA [Patescibacteria group bacterium]
MSRGDILIGIDIGASAVRTVISQKQGEESKPLILGVGTTPSFGINNGVVVD